MKILASLLLCCCFFVVSEIVAQNDAPALPTVTGFDCPKYPSDAASMCLSGTVKLQVTTDGHQVVNVKLVSGHPILARAAMKNVQTWKFAETSPTTFTVVYVYANEGIYKPNPVTKCSAKMELPTHITVSGKSACQ
jgi:TonB-like protein